MRQNRGPGNLAGALVDSSMARPADDSRCGYYHSPRLGIVYVLAWIGAFAALMFLRHVGDFDVRSPGSMSAQRAMVFDGAVILRYSVLAAGVAGLLLMMIGKVKDHDGWLQPGHWLLLICTSQLLLATLAPVAFSLVVPQQLIEVREGCFIWPIAIFAVSYFVAALLSMLAIYRSHESWYWQAVYSSILVWSLMMLLRYAWKISYPTHLFDLSPPAWTSAITGLALLAIFASWLTALVLDLVNQESRDWLHWLAMAVPAVYSATCLVLRCGEPPFYFRLVP